MATRVRSYSKINLGLAVGPTRADGFHGLATVYQTLALHDIVAVTAKPATETAVTLSSNHPGVPRTDAGNAAKNTAYKMVAEALAAMGLSAEVHIDIHKTLPVQGGMGAGSANAAAALIGLEKQLNQQLASEARLAIAGKVGSDVPLFLVGGTVLGKGRGEVVSELPDLPATWAVVALPRVGVSTPQAFRDLDAKMAAEAEAAGLSAASAKSADFGRDDKFGGIQTAGLSTALRSGRDDKGGEWAESGRDYKFGEGAEAGRGDKGVGALTSGEPVDKIEKLSRVLSGVFTHAEDSSPTGIVLPDPVSGTNQNDLAEKTLLALVRTGIENDFEEVAFSQHPFLRDIKRQLMGSETAGNGEGVALYAALSGSGSALFGLYGSQADAVAAQQRVQQAGTQAILTETLPRQAYWERMFAE